jgi:hypothetical protein
MSTISGTITDTNGNGVARTVRCIGGIPGR